MEVPTPTTRPDSVPTLPTRPDPVPTPFTLTHNRIQESKRNDSVTFLLFGVDPRWHRDGNPFWLAQIHSVLKCRKTRRVGKGSTKWYIKKDQWYVNITWMEQISKDNSVDFKIGKKDISLLEAALIDPENGGLLKVVMVNDHKLDTKFVEYVKDVIDLKGFTDPASKGSK